MADEREWVGDEGEGATSLEVARPRRIATGLRRHGLSRRPRALRPFLRRKGLRFTEGNAFELYECGRDAFPRMLAAIERARSFIHLETYILRADRVGLEFIEALRRRAADGIEVRLLYDAIGSLELSQEVLRPLQRAGGDVVAFNPLRRFYPRWAPRRRDHRKLLIVDGEVGFTGGLNLGVEYDAPAVSEAGTTGWRDSHLMLRGPAVRDLAAVFLESWYRAGGSELPWGRLLDAAPSTVAGTLRCAVLPDGPVYRRRAMRDLIVDALDATTTRACLVSPYFAPGRAILDALERAARRGVRVDLVVAGQQTDHALLRRGARRSIERLVYGGVRVYEYASGILHTKSAVFDGGFAIVGSSNLDRQSLQHNYEVNVVTERGALSQAIEAQLEDDLFRSTPLTRNMLAQRGFLARAVDWAAAALLSLVGAGDPR